MFYLVQAKREVRAFMAAIFKKMGKKVFTAQKENNASKASGRRLRKPSEHIEGEEKARSVNKQPPFVSRPVSARVTYTDKPVQKPCISRDY